ncbi:MAG: hypothetical protein AAB428_00970 [Patescibacteria group bacterium]
MDQISQNQTSFIPRKTPGLEVVREKPIGLFMVIAALVFVIAVLGSGSIFLYKYIISKSIDTAGKYLSERKEALEPTTIDELIRTDKRLRSANELLNKHIVATPVFKLLEDITLESVRFSKFEYIVDQVKGASVKVSGEAKSYGSIALQADNFNNEKRFIKNAVFSNLNLNEKGNVTFEALISFDPDLISYKKMLTREASSSIMPTQ